MDRCKNNIFSPLFRVSCGKHFLPKLMTSQDIPHERVFGWGWSQILADVVVTNLGGQIIYTASQRADLQNCVLETHFFLLSQQSPLSLFVCLFHLLLICEMFYLLLDTQYLSITQLRGLPDRKSSKLSHVVPIKCFLTKSRQQKEQKKKKKSESLTLSVQVWN